MEKLKIAYPIIVEGKYDRLKLLSVCEGLIIKTDGFGVFKREEKSALIRALAKKSPIIVLTDSDGGGRVIRSHISSLVPRDRLIQLYIPRIEGKERRKAEPSKEGVLGVEGMEAELLYKMLEPFSVSGDEGGGQSFSIMCVKNLNLPCASGGCSQNSGIVMMPSGTNDESTYQKWQEIANNPLSKVDFFIDGLTGGENSAKKRDELAQRFGLPAKMTPNALLEALKVVATYEEYLQAVGREVGES